jgi:hypothetical protein
MAIPAATPAILAAANGELNTRPARAPPVRGEFFEALNWAGREKLPVVFLVENNGWAISVPQQAQTGSQIHRIAQGFGIRTFYLLVHRFKPGSIQ